MNTLVNIWKTVYELLVDDGWMAAGTIAAFAVTGLWTLLARSNDALRDLGGPLLAALLLVLLFINLYTAGAKAARRLQETPPARPHPTTKDGAPDYAGD